MLSRLPPEAFAPLASYLSGLELCLLWVTGNACLQLLLSHTPIEFRLVFEGWRRASLPRLISRFTHLHRLHLTCSTSTCPVFDFDLTLIPPNVRHIDLGTLDVQPHIRGLFYPPSPDHRTLTQLFPHLESLSFDGVLHIASMDALPPLLRYWNFRLDMPAHLLSKVPDHVLTLKFGHSFHLNDDTDTIRFPLELQEVCFSAPLPSRHLEAVISHLPSELRRFSFTMASSERLAFRTPDWSHLPNMLLQLEMQLCENVRLESLSSLPPNLTHLCITLTSPHRLTSSITANLPPKLSILKLDCTRTAQLTIDTPAAPVLSSLPRTITDLHLKIDKVKGEKVNMKWLTLLPPWITSLYCPFLTSPFPDSPTPEEWHYYPCRLTKIDLGLILQAPETEEIWNSLPSSLHSVVATLGLNTQRPFSQSEFVRKLAVAAPEVTNLQLKQMLSFETMPYQSHILQADNGLLIEKPERVVQIACTSFAKLNSLSIDATSTRTLRTIGLNARHLDCLEHLTVISRSIQSWTEAPDILMEGEDDSATLSISGAEKPEMPPRLVSVLINAAHPSVFTAFQKHPTLQHINVTLSSTVFAKEIFKDLPRRLCKLNLSFTHSSKCLTFQDVPSEVSLLPRCLFDVTLHPISGVESTDVVGDALGRHLWRGVVRLYMLNDRVTIYYPQSSAVEAPSRM